MMLSVIEDMSKRSSIYAVFICILFLYVIIILYMSRLKTNFQHVHLNSNGENRAVSNSSSNIVSNISIFYNVFVPDNKSKMFANTKDPPTEEYALKIIEEQLSYKKVSIVNDAPLYYMSNGKEINKLPGCGLNCHKIDYSLQGNELKTLKKLFDFCVANRESKVAYIHNKGSFHPSNENDLLRRLLTKAVFSNECLSPPKNNICNCNVCSSRFSPLPHFHTPGNMWVAECSYISKLSSPITFGLKMDEAVKSAPKTIFGDVKKISITHVGRGRFSAEHWVHSHPDVCPCDVYPGPYTWGYERLPQCDEWETNLVNAPRFPFLSDYANEEYLLSVLKTKLGAWFSLEGRLHEWKSLYGKIPPKSSWVWNYFSNETY